MASRPLDELCKVPLDLGRGRALVLLPSKRPVFPHPGANGHVTVNGTVVAAVDPRRNWTNDWNHRDFIVRKCDDRSIHQMLGFDDDDGEIRNDRELLPLDLFFHGAKHSRQLCHSKD